MVVTVTMPQLGESVTEGTVTRWLKREGEHVEADEPLLEISTDKVDTEVPAPASGTLIKITAAEDETVQVGQELAIIGDAAEGGTSAPSAPAATPAAAPAEPAAVAEPVAAPIVEEAPAAAPAAESTPAPVAAPVVAQTPAPPAPTEAQAPAAAAAPVAVASAEPEPAPVATESHAGGVYVTPLVRKLASDHGIDLGRLQGTGVGGRIRKQDVLDATRNSSSAPAAATAPIQSTPSPTTEAPAAPAAAAAPAAVATPARPAVTQTRGGTQPLSRLRRVIAERMVQSLQVSAQLTTVVEVDVTEVARLRKRAQAGFQEREGVKLTFLPFFAMAAVEALKDHPTLNASLDQEAGTVTFHETTNLGIAVDTERGLLVPVIHDAGDLNMGGFARKIADLAERTRTNKVTPDELSGGTFTLTNTGSRGALFDTPIINQPQVAILGTGSVVKRPVVVEDADLGEVVAVRSMVYLALTYDHRLVDGADAARFLVSIKERLELGDFEADLGL